MQKYIFYINEKHVLLLHIQSKFIKRRIKSNQRNITY